MSKALKRSGPSAIVKKDIDRTFAHFRKLPEFEKLLQEAILLLQMFAVT